MKEQLATARVGVALRSDTTLGWQQRRSNTKRANTGISSVADIGLEGIAFAKSALFKTTPVSAFNAWGIRGAHKVTAIPMLKAKSWAETLR